MVQSARLNRQERCGGRVARPRQKARRAGERPSRAGNYNIEGLRNS